MLDSLSIYRVKFMQKYLYDDLYKLEEIHWWHKAKRNLVSYFLQKYLKDKTNKILDAGCGTGKNLEAFSKYGRVWGIDLANDAISFCKKRGFKNVIAGSIESIPFDNGTFDCVTALDVLEHVDDSKALKEINRVLNREGILIITVPAFQWLWSRWDEVLHHKRRYTKDGLEGILQKNGFKIIKVSCCYSFLFFPALIIRVIKNLIYKDYYPSDFKLSNKIINSLLGNITGFEKFFIINSQIPFGTSLIVIAQRINT